MVGRIVWWGGKCDGAVWDEYQFQASLQIQIYSGQKKIWRIQIQNLFWLKFLANTNMN